MKTLITIFTLLLLSTTAYGATYKSISVTPEAKAKIVSISKELKMTQRDTASKMIMEWGEPKNNLLENLKTLFGDTTTDTKTQVYNLCKLLES